MPKRASPSIARLAAAALLLTSMANYPARAEHSLVELRANYSKLCSAETLWGQEVRKNINISKERFGIAEYNGCFGEKKSEICYALLTDLKASHRVLKLVLNYYWLARDKCNRAREAYTQALTEAVLTKWLLGEDPPKTAKKTKKLPVKSAKKKKAKSARKRPAKAHTTEASNAAAAMVIIGIIGGYVGSKAARKKMRRAPSGGSGRRSGGHHHAGSGYN